MRLKGKGPVKLKAFWKLHVKFPLKYFVLFKIFASSSYVASKRNVNILATVYDWKGGNGEISPLPTCMDPLMGQPSLPGCWLGHIPRDTWCHGNAHLPPPPAKF